MPAKCLLYFFLNRNFFSILIFIFFVYIWHFYKNVSGGIFFAISLLGISVLLLQKYFPNVFGLEKKCQDDEGRQCPHELKVR